MEVGAAAAAATAGVGAGLFSYNRGNYMFDQKNHYTRFTAGLNMAIAQTGLYKQDIAQLTELTVTRQDCYHGIAAMGLTILTAIYCPGRVGLHEPPPPGWLMGLEFVNIAGCYLFLGLALWFAMHASMRADTAATHMLTRFVRLPIPSQGMLDKARKFLASYEEQPLKEVLRVPFTSHARKGTAKYNEDMDIDQLAAGRARHGYDVPAWYRKEKMIDNAHVNETIESMMPLDAKGSAPEHFKAYREIQMEWFPYDVYSRLSIFLAFMHLLHCWAYLQIGYLFGEVRALWACAIVILQMFVLQQVILTLDIVPCGFPAHRLGPFGLWFAFFGAVIEYKRWFDEDIMKLGYVLVYLAYACHIIYTLQLLRLCRPSEDAPVVAETPGASWWPGEWRLPSAFQHAIWLVAPPKALEPGQVDIVGELRDAQTAPSAAIGVQAEVDKRRDVHRALGVQGESPAWFSVKVGLVAMLVAWGWLTFGFTIEIINQGTAHPSLLSAPGMPNNARDPRYRPAKIGRKEPTEVGTGGVAAGPARGVHMGGLHRRLLEAEAPTAASRQAIAGKLRELLPVLMDLAAERPQAAAPAAAAATPEPLAVRWPALLEPALLACAGHAEGAVALSRHGRGAHLPLGGGEVEATAFALQGLAGHGSVMAASWDREGLLVLASSGALLRCPGAPAAKWRCELAEGSPLALAPGGRGFSGSVALGRGEDGILAAVRFPEEDTVVVYGRGAAGAWLPRGEVGAPGAAAAFAPGGNLLLQQPDGGVSELSLASGRVAELAAASRGFDGHAWASSCRTAGGNLLRMAVARDADTQGPRAKLVLG